jgi:uncharacterized membrane protein
MAFLYIFLLFLTPWLLSKAEIKIKPLKLTGIVVNCFLFGSLIGHLFADDKINTMVNQVAEVVVLLGLPLLLFSSDIMGWMKLAKTTVIAFTIHILMVVLFCLIFGFIFRSHHPDVWKASGMLTGIFIGGTPNLIAVGKALELSMENILIVNAAEMVTGGIFFFFIMSFGIRIAGRFLIPFDHSQTKDQEEDWQKEENHFYRLKQSKKVISFLISLSISLIVVGLSVGISFLLWKKIDVITVMMSLSAIAVFFSLNKKIRHIPGSTIFGNYLLNVFCVAIGSMARVDQIKSDSMIFLVLCVCILICVFIFDLILCRLFKVDRDTCITTMIAGVFGPPFIPPVCEGLKNSAMIIPGVSSGLVGFAVGNFLGLLVSYLLKS